MGKVIFDMSISLDGYIAGADRTPQEPLGRGGERLHDYGEAAGDCLDRLVAETGSIIAGRTTYDHSVPWWGANGPIGKPVIVLTHAVPEEYPEDSVYTFVVDGLQAALDAAQAAAGDGDVAISGADTGQQYLAAGLIDEVSIHLVPVLLGGGTRMFGQLPAVAGPVSLVESLETPGALHLRYALGDDRHDQTTTSVDG